MDILAKFPPQIAVSSRPGAQTYTLMPGYYALHGQRSGTDVPAPAYVINEGKVGVFKGSPDPAIVTNAPDKVSPVYLLSPGGSPAVPTGLVFIRFTDGVEVGERLGEIKKAGYKVAETLAYAPNAAWLRAQSGNIADALAGLKALEKIPSVESVEPQMLMESARR
ncbi:MAG: hypothetical protein H7Z16_03715 [Pyrinomonadaceae bacterium]|nr:hypothetical protein [Pyrinomonadaceae bacterium]